jgi:hypothetical protein
MALRRLTLLAVFAAAALAAVGGSAPTASAETTCLRAGPDVLYVFMSEHGDVTELKRYRTSSRINVIASTGPIECAGDPPLVSDIEAIYIIDQSEDLSTAAGNDGSTRVVIGEPAALAPGKTIETTGASEIELLVDTKGGRDELIAGGDATQQLGHDIIVGQDGLSWTTDADADMLGMPFPIVELRGDAERDQLSGQGGFGTGAPLSTARSFRVDGGPAGGNDLLRGSDILAGDDIAAGDGSQTIAAETTSSTADRGATPSTRPRTARA